MTESASWEGSNTPLFADTRSGTPWKPSSTQTKPIFPLWSCHAGSIAQFNMTTAVTKPAPCSVSCCVRSGGGGHHAPWEGRQAPPDASGRIHAQISTYGMRVSNDGRAFLAARDTKVGIHSRFPLSGIVHRIPNGLHGDNPYSAFLFWTAGRD
jgi:hypothetical protein